MAWVVDRFSRRLIAISMLVIGGSITASLLMTQQLVAEMDAESRGHALWIAFVVPAIVAPIGVGSICWLAIRNQRLLEKVNWLANHDDLTGLLNRRAFLDRATARLGTGDVFVALALADLDHFKQVNDRLGHSAGDVALRHVAERLVASVPDGSLVARLGGEEFAILFEWTHGAEVKQRIEQVCNTIANSPFAVEGTGPVSITVSIGVAVAAEGDAVDALLKRADMAMYAAKNNGRNQARLAA